MPNSKKMQHKLLNNLGDTDSVPSSRARSLVNYKVLHTSSRVLATRNGVKSIIYKYLDEKVLLRIISKTPSKLHREIKVSELIGLLSKLFQLA